MFVVKIKNSTQILIVNILIVLWLNERIDFKDLALQKHFKRNAYLYVNALRFPCNSETL